MSFEPFGLFYEKFRLYKIKYEYFKQLNRLSQSIFDVFENFFVLQRESYNKFYSSFLLKGLLEHLSGSTVNKINIYPNIKK